MSEHQILKEALKKWGEYSQLDMVVEECAELIKAVQKVKRYADPAKCCVAIPELSGEIADVQIMLEQLFILYPQLEKSVPKDRIEKLKRLEWRLKQ